MKHTLMLLGAVATSALMAAEITWSEPDAAGVTIGTVTLTEEEATQPNVRLRFPFDVIGAADAEPALLMTLHGQSYKYTGKGSGNEATPDADGRYTELGRAWINDRGMNVRFTHKDSRGTYDGVYSYKGLSSTLPAEGKTGRLLVTMTRQPNADGYWETTVSWSGKYMKFGAYEPKIVSAHLIGKDRTFTFRLHHPNVSGWDIRPAKINETYWRGTSGKWTEVMPDFGDGDDVVLRNEGTDPITVTLDRPVIVSTLRIQGNWNIVGRPVTVNDDGTDTRADNRLLADTVTVATNSQLAWNGTVQSDMTFEKGALLATSTDIADILSVDGSVSGYIRANIPYSVPPTNAFPILKIDKSQPNLTINCRGIVAEYEGGYYWRPGERPAACATLTGGDAPIWLSKLHWTDEDGKSIDFAAWKEANTPAARRIRLTVSGKAELKNDAGQLSFGHLTVAPADSTPAELTLTGSALTAPSDPGVYPLTVEPGVTLNATQATLSAAALTGPDVTSCVDGRVCFSIKEDRSVTSLLTGSGSVQIRAYNHKEDAAPYSVTLSGNGWGTDEADVPAPSLELSGPNLQLYTEQGSIGPIRSDLILNNPGSSSAPSLAFGGVSGEHGLDLTGHTLTLAAGTFIRGDSKNAYIKNGTIRVLATDDIPVTLGIGGKYGGFTVSAPIKGRGILKLLQEDPIPTDSFVKGLAGFISGTVSDLSETEPLAVLVDHDETATRDSVRLAGDNTFTGGLTVAAKAKLSVTAPWGAGRGDIRVGKEALLVVGKTTDRGANPVPKKLWELFGTMNIAAGRLLTPVGEVHGVLHFEDGAGLNLTDPDGYTPPADGTVTCAGTLLVRATKQQVTDGLVFLTDTDIAPEKVRVVAADGTPLAATAVQTDAGLQLVAADLPPPPAEPDILLPDGTVPTAAVADAMKAAAAKLPNAAALTKITLAYGTVKGEPLTAKQAENALAVFGESILTAATDGTEATLTVAYEFGITAMTFDPDGQTLSLTVEVTDGTQPAALAPGAQLRLHGEAGILQTLPAMPSGKAVFTVPLGSSGTSFRAEAFKE